MKVRVDDHQLRANSRSAAIALALFTLHLMERWRRDVDDYDCAMILIAVVVISAERLLKTGVDPADRSLGTEIDPAKLRKCNISSIAHATGLNRETARRKVNDLIKKDILARLGDGSIGFRPGFQQEASTIEVIDLQVKEAATLVNHLLKLKVLAQG